jgi:hypothetical protein
MRTALARFSPVGNMEDFMPVRGGLVAALDFTKLLVWLAAGGIALIAELAILRDSAFLIMTLILLAICLISGLFVFSRGAMMLAQENYDIEDSRLKRAGRINVFSFGAGFGFLVINIAIVIFSAP